jgi:hypothetical protein
MAHVTLYHASKDLINGIDPRGGGFNSTQSGPNLWMRASLTQSPDGRPQQCEIELPLRRQRDTACI